MKAFPLVRNVLLCSVVSAGVALAAEVTATSRIVRVTVFPDRAEVVRQAEVRVAQGESDVVFEGLPADFEADSLRVSARGVPSTLGAIETRDIVRNPVPGPELAAAEKEVLALEDELREIAQEDASDKEALEFLRVLRANPSAAATPVALPRTDPQALQQTYAFVRAQLDDFAKRALARTVRQRTAQEKLAIARAKRDAERPVKGLREKQVAVAVEAKQAGTVTMELSYMMHRAGWRPAYRAILDAEKGVVEFTSEGVVMQHTDEDWSGVALQLSTASPARGVAPPVLVSAVVSPLQDRVTASRASGGVLGGTLGGVLAEPAPQYKQNAYENMYVVDGVNTVDTTAAVARAQVVSTAYSVMYAVPGRVNVPADGHEHRMRLRFGALPVKLGYRVVAPREGAYIVGTGRMSADYPLLAGPVRVFSGASYVGEVQLEEQGPGAEIVLPFGTDDRVVVKRVVAPDRVTQEGFGGKDEQVTRNRKTRVENRRAEPVTVVVSDRVPESTDERIVVKRTEATTAGAKENKDRRGVLEWELTIPPGESREVVLEYTIRHPRELPVSESDRP